MPSEMSRLLPIPLEIRAAFCHNADKKGKRAEMRYDSNLNKVVFTREYLEGNGMFEDCMKEMVALFSDGDCERRAERNGGLV